MAIRVRRKTAVIRSSGSSKKIQVHTHTGSHGLKRKSSTLLNKSDSARAKIAREQELAFRWENTSQQDRDKLNDIIDATYDSPYNNDDGWDDDDDADAILRGDQRVEASHAGGELCQLMEKEAREAQQQEQGNQKKRYRDGRTRRDRTLRRTQAFDIEMVNMVEAYLWVVERFGPTCDPEKICGLDGDVLQGTYELKGVDIFANSSVGIHLNQGDKSLPFSIVRQGFIPCAAGRPSVAISIRVLELFRRANLRCPRMAVQPFVKTLCDLHGVAFKPYLAEQFRISFDVYLAIRREVDRRVLEALGRNSPHWRVKNACPCCLYKLEGEPALAEFDILVTMDGNDSLKRLIRRELVAPQDDGEPILGEARERKDIRNGRGDYILSHEFVDRWEKDVDEEMIADVPEQDTWGNPCEGRWSNMKKDSLKKMWGIFDEAGLFLSLCRHSFVLVAADMVRSGELAKYPLAVVDYLLANLEGTIGNGYDIGCKFKSTIAKSLLQPIAATRYKSLVGAFHGHAHNRRCQLDFLATYVPGLGLEYLEQCEQFFSESNELASSVRYATTFHRHQAITSYLQHKDRVDTYANLSTILCNNYKRALAVLDMEPELDRLMKDFDMEDRSEFEEWLSEEKEYLQGLSREPPEETMQMEYYKKLLKLRGYQQDLAVMRADTFRQEDGTQALSNNRTETQRRKLLERHTNALDEVSELEDKLNIAIRWLPGSFEWQDAAALVANSKYQRALDQLEGLVCSRLMELTRMNMARTGYNLRKHIAKALQSRCKAVKSALARYNAAALALGKEELRYEEICEYSFLADFDLLRDTRGDIRHRPWATPKGRQVMDMHFKSLGARVELKRLDVEIARFVTYMCDEEQELLAVQHRLTVENPQLACQVGLYRLERARFNSVHFQRLYKLAKDPRVSAICRGTRRQAPADAVPPGNRQTPEPEQSRNPSPPSVPHDNAQPLPLPSNPSNTQAPDASSNVLMPEDLFTPEEQLNDDDADAEDDAEEEEVWRQTFSLVNGVFIVTGETAQKPNVLFDDYDDM